MGEITECPITEKKRDILIFRELKEVTLNEAIALKKKLFPEVKGILCEAVTADKTQFIWVMRLLYGNGYEVIKKK